MNQRTTRIQGSTIYVTCRKIAERVKWRTVNYLRNSSVHGLRYVVDEKSHWFERLFWLLVVVVCIYFTYSLFLSTWINFDQNPISFVTDTSYLNWNTTFPATSVCQADDKENELPAYATKRFGEHPWDLNGYMSSVLFFDGTCYVCSAHCGKSFQCPTDFDEIAKNVLPPCSTLITNCSWNDKTFECCDMFERMQTELGICYIINSMQGPRYTNLPDYAKELPLISNQETGPGVIKFKVNRPVNIYIHAPQDIPGFNIDPLTWWSLKNMRDLDAKFQINEITNDPLLVEVPITRRECKFLHETSSSSIYPLYSYSTCVTECRIKQQIKLCGCHAYTAPRKDNSTNRTCDVAGYTCLHNKADELRRIFNPTTEQNLICDCLPSCTEPELRLLTQNKQWESGTGNISIAMESLPSLRYSRNVVRTKLDLVVSLGGAAGLFLGASLLSIVELIYYCCIRKREVSIEEETIKRKSPKRKETHTIQKSTYYPRDFLTSRKFDY